MIPKKIRRTTDATDEEEESKSYMILLLKFHGNEALRFYPPNRVSVRIILHVPKSPLANRSTRPEIYIFTNPEANGEQRPFCTGYLKNRKDWRN